MSGERWREGTEEGRGWVWSATKERFWRESTKGEGGGGVGEMAVSSQTTLDT